MPHPFGESCVFILPSSHKRSLYVALVVAVLWGGIVATDLFLNGGSLYFALGMRIRSIETVALICSPLVLGLLAFYLGSQKRRLQDRLRLLLEARDFSNPRLGAEWCLTTSMEKVRAFYGADGFLFIDLPEGDSRYRIHRNTPGGRPSAVKPETISQECEGRLLVVPETRAFVWSPSGMPILRRRYIEYDVLYNKPCTNNLSAVKSLSVLLEAESIVSVPVFLRGKVAGRFFLTSRRRRFFYAEDPAFLLKFLGQSQALIENLCLVDNLVASASERERKHIALDMHDSVVQPYIGIQLGLSAIRRKVQAGGIDISEDLEKVAKMAQLEISSLRHFIGELSVEGKHNGQFLPAVQRLTEKFAAATGIAVDVRACQDIDLNERLAAEAFQMIAEGLSNIRRHTAASEAIIEINCRNENLHLRISNDGRNDRGTSGEFVPKSLTSRAASLGGKVRVDLSSQDKTVLDIGIPF
jgi:signal transduction histidine kinase